MDPLVLVTGASGQVGLALRPLLAQARFMSHAALDVTDADAVERATEGVDVILHLGALTNVDECEADPARANRINSDGTRTIVAAAGRRRARVVYLSTDYVFDGTKLGEYDEDDEPSPINQYGRSKLAGERHVAAMAGNSIVRTSWVFGEGHNFIRTILSAAAERDVVQVVGDQRGRPTYAGDLARALVAMIRASFEGIVHVAGDGTPCTWADLARWALEKAGSRTVVESISSEAYRAAAKKVIAPRPANSTLSLLKAKQHGVPLFDWRTSVSRYVATLVKQ